MYSLEINFLKNRGIAQGGEGEKLPSTPRNIELKDIVPVAVGLMVAVVLVGGALGIKIYQDGENEKLQDLVGQVDSSLKQIQAKKKKIAVIKKETEGINAQTEALATVFNQIKPWSALLQEMRDRTPASVQIEELKQVEVVTRIPGKNNKEKPTQLKKLRIEITGLARSYKDVNDFMLLLTKSSFLSGKTELVSARMQNNPTRVEGVELPPVVNYKIRTFLSDAPAEEILAELERKGAVGLAQSTTPTATPRPQVTSPVQLPRLQNGAPVWPQAQNVAPPLRPRAIAPPVGDISVSTIDSSASTINLGSNELVPRLVLRDAPVRDVLSLLARVAGLNIAFSIEKADVGPTITLDVENEPVQDVFNNILRVTGLEANRMGPTIFVGKKLPIAASQIVTRTLRLNQVPVQSAAAFLAIQGAFSQRVVTKTTRTTQGEGVGRVVREETETAIEALTGKPDTEEGIGPLLLKGLSVVTDERLNAITLIGEARKVEMATAFLIQQDLRRRQVAVNVKIIDVNLSATDNFNSSFSFGIGDSFFVVDSGQGIANFGRLTPPSAEDTTLNRFGRPILPNPLTQQPFENDGPRLFLNPDGNQQIRDPASGQFVPVGPNAAGSIFSPGGVPSNPGITGITPQQLPAGASAPLYLDAQGIPRPANELTIGGGNIAPFISPEGDLVQARAFRVGITGTAGVPQQFFDFQGNPRLPSQLANPGDIPGFTGSIQPLLHPNGTPVTAVTGVLGNPGVSTSSPLFFDVNSIPRTLSQLTIAGGSFQPLFE